MKIYHICYHTDEDGRAAAAIIYEYLKIINKPNCNKIKYAFYKIDYTVDLKTIISNNIPAGDELYFVDYSFSNKDNLDYVLGLSNNNIKVTWIDHHKTSYDIISNNNFKNYPNFQYYINTKYCGAYLSYVYAYLNINNITDVDFEDIDEYINYIPLYIKYVDSWDTWKHNMPKTTEFNLGMKLENPTPKSTISTMLKFNSDIISKLFSNKKEDADVIKYYMKKYIDNIISKGSTIKEYEANENEMFCDKYGFEFTIVEHISFCKSKVYKCFALNKRGNSTMFGDRFMEYDIVVPFIFDGDRCIYSLYSYFPTVDCEHLAKIFGSINNLGGGGHKSAAGFQLYGNIIKSDCTIHIAKKIFSKNKYIVYL